MKSEAKTILLVFFLALSLHAADTINICWLGSSSRAQTPEDVKKFAAERGIPVKYYYAPKTTSWEAVLRDTSLMDTIRSGVFHYVEMMALYNPTGSYETYKANYIATGRELARIIDSVGSIPILWMRRMQGTVAPLIFTEANGEWSVNMQDTLNEVNFELAEPSFVYASPVAVGSQELVKKGFRVTSDGTHPTEWQKYLAACVWVATLFRENPTGRIANPNPLVDSVTKHFIQQVAWNVTMTERMKSNLPPWTAEPVRVKRIDLSDNISSIERYLSFKINVDFIYENDSIESNSVNAVYSSLTPSIASVDYYGTVTAKEIGRACIEVWRETERETLSVDIVPSTAILDSVAITPKQITGYVENGFKFTANGYFTKGDQSFITNLDGAVEWLSSDTTQFKVTNGYLERIGAEGGDMVLRIEKDGKTDSVAFVMAQKLSVIRRINFQPYDTMFSEHWDTEWNRVYDPVRGYGWTVNKPSSSNLSINRNMIDFHDSLFIRSTAVSPGAWAKYDEGTFKLNIPDGDYIIKVCMGEYLSGKTCLLRLDDDPLVKKLSGDGNDTLVKFTTNKTTKSITTDTIELRTDNGLNLNIRGYINYLIIISKEGVDIDLVAYDTREAFGGGGTTSNDAASVSSGKMPYLTVTPNPFNPAINIVLHEISYIREVGIYGVSGQKIVDLTNSLRGNRADWNATGMPSGLYLVKVLTGERTMLKRVMLMK